MSLNAFKAYDIRGVYGTELDETLAYRVGRCLPAVLSAKTVLVGRDMRLSSPALRDALVRGLREAGADVGDIGVVTTPMTYFFTAELGYDASVMITASHNPLDHNGMKVSSAGARPVGYAGGLNTVEAMIERDALPPPAVTPGALRDEPVTDRYLAWMRARLPDISGLKVVIDGSDGAAGPFVRALFGDGPEYVNIEPDGHFPHHGPNPLEPTNRTMVAARVRGSGADLGLIFDGDADRVMCVDETGTFVSPDMLIPFIADFLLPPDSEGRRIDPETGKPAIVIHDVRTSRGVTEKLREDGFATEMVRVGAAFAKADLRRLHALCGGELAGHYYFRDFHWCDSGILAALRILGLTARAKAAGKPLSALVREVAGRYCATGEINFRDIPDRTAAVGAVVTALLKRFGAPETRSDIDGVRLDWCDSWIGVRVSNTEPILRVSAEARKEAKLTALTACVRETLGR